MRHPSVPMQMFLASAVAIVGIWSSLPVTELRAAPSSQRMSWSQCYRDLGLPFECGTV
jgi:hypothetical protein